MPATVVDRWLPLELIEIIITQAWQMPLTAKERTTLMTSLPLVSKTCLALYSRTAHTHVHIPCLSYFEIYLARMRSDIHCQRQLCQSIHLSIDASKLVHNLSSPENKLVINLLYALHTTLVLPNLHTLVLNYTGGHLDEILLRLSRTFEFAPFPSQVSDLTFILDTPPWSISSLCCRTTGRDHLIGALPSIRHLTIKGATEFAIASIVSACPALETLRVRYPPPSCFDNACRCSALLAFHHTRSSSVLFSTTHLSIRLYSTSSHGDYWDGVQVGREADLDVFHRCDVAQDDLPLTFAAIP